MRANQAAIWSAAAVLLTGFLAVWIGFGPFEDDMKCQLGEGTAVEYELSLTPPGATECRITLRNGDHTEQTVMPWRSWISLVPFALAAGLTATSVTSAGAWRRLGSITGAGLLAVLGVAVLFGVV